VRCVVAGSLREDCFGSAQDIGVVAALEGGLNLSERR
jgi:hypothetical protein